MITATKNLQDVDGALAFKKDVEDRLLLAAKLDSRKYASAIYSIPQPCPVLWLNFNPGGAPESAIILTDREIAQGRHEFFDGHGNTSRQTGACLAAMFPDAGDRVRSVQGSNVIWQRSVTSDNINKKYAAEITAPFLREYIDFVHSALTIFGGIGSYNLFCKSQKANIINKRNILIGPYRGAQGKLFYEFGY